MNAAWVFAYLWASLCIALGIHRQRPWKTLHRPDWWASLVLFFLWPLAIFGEIAESVGAACLWVVKGTLAAYPRKKVEGHHGADH